MVQGLTQYEEMQGSEAFEALWMLLTAIVAVGDEVKLARLTATGLPSLLRCSLSGMALQQETGPSWNLVLQKCSQLRSAVDMEADFAVLKPLMQEAMDRGPLWLSHLEGEPIDGPIAASLERLAVQWLAVVPLLTLHSQIGLLVAGGKDLDDFSRNAVFILQTLAEHLAVTIENLRLHQRQQQYTQDLQILVEERTAELRLSQERYRQAYEEIAALKARLQEENVYLKDEIKTCHNFEEIIGESQTLKKILRTVELAAPTDSTILLLGETGTGKELVARAVHHLSPRKRRALVKVNCAALPAGLIESELFGHEKGAFTGALFRKIGRFELADGGTIFLDEIGDLPLGLQAKLLRVLQDGELERLGGSHTIKVDVRVIAATNRNLKRAMQEGTFRPDLYYRLHVFPIRLPPLRERKEDIPLLVKYFATKYGTKVGKRIETIPQKTLDALLAYPWPGNVRELENIIERAVILSQRSQLELGEWFPAPESASDEAQIPTLKELEQRHIIAALRLTGWRVSGEKGAARLLGLKPTTLEARMKKHGITRKQREGSPYSNLPQRLRFVRQLPPDL
jgi:transcriptional regulator with GAF, ATPase, and Fis domain